MTKYPFPLSKQLWQVWARALRVVWEDGLGSELLTCFSLERSLPFSLQQFMTSVQNTSRYKVLTSSHVCYEGKSSVNHSLWSSKKPKAQPGALLLITWPWAKLLASIFFHNVLAHSGYYNNMPWAGWLLKSRNLFLSATESRKSMIKILNLMFNKGPLFIGSVF